MPVTVWLGLQLADLVGFVVDAVVQSAFSPTIVYPNTTRIHFNIMGVLYETYSNISNRPTILPANEEYL